jgi:hypothetical protein
MLISLLTAYLHLSEGEYILEQAPFPANPANVLLSEARQHTRILFLMASVYNFFFQLGVQYLQ